MIAVVGQKRNPAQGQESVAVAQGSNLELLRKNSRESLQQCEVMHLRQTSGDISCMCMQGLQLTIAVFAQQRNSAAATWHQYAHEY